MYLDKTKSAGWLALIEDSKKYFDSYQGACKNIDRKYANLDAMRDAGDLLADTDFTLFWSNDQVMGPSIYARPPLPAITPRFKDRRPLYRTASELLERVVHTTFDMADINQTMLSLRNDLTVIGRGVAWVRFDDEDGEKKVCIEHLYREDFLCEPARDWSCVGWVARCGWLTKDEMEDRFGEDVAESVDYVVRDRMNQRESQENNERCAVWEMWHKSENIVVWVVEGVEDTLDHGEPPIKIEGFFPCPRPAFGTVQRGTLIAIPDILQYQTQLDGINELTRRIHVLMNGLQMKGFYQGGGEIGDAVEAAMNSNDPGRLMVPISNMAEFASNGGSPVVWMPIDQVATTLTACVELRRQLIDDVYQIIGLSDIMRGSTEAQETATAQSIKQQNGSVRVRDKQQELVRIARDLCRIVAEIIAEEYTSKQLIDMSQMDLPTNSDIKSQIKDLNEYGKKMAAEMKRLESDPAIQQKAQQKPEAAQQAIQQFQGQMQQIQQQIDELSQKVTSDQVVTFLRDNKLRPFVMDIETDSTIYPDEQAEKASRAEFLQVFMQAMSGVSQLATLGPQALALAGGFLKFTLAPYRVGRELDSLIDDFVDSAPQMAEQMQAQQGEGEGDMKELAAAEMEKAKAQMAKVEADTALKQADQQQAMTRMQGEFQEKQAKMQLEQGKMEMAAQKQAMDAQKMQADIDNIRADTMKKLVEAKVAVDNQALDQFKSLKDIELRETDQAMGVQQNAVDTNLRMQDSERSAAMGERQQTLAERQSMQEKE